MSERLPLRELIARHKSHLQEGQRALASRFEQDGDVITALSSRSALIDDILRNLLVDLQLQDKITLCAVGGYGRGELWPGSDIDLLVLLPNEPDSELSACLESWSVCSGILDWKSGTASAPLINASKSPQMT